MLWLPILLLITFINYIHVGTSLIVENLHKSYGDVKAVNGLSFQVEEGMIYGLLGPNGAGKTTTLNVVSGVLERDSGRVLVYGYDPAVNERKVKSLIGYVPEEQALYESLTPREFFEFVASVRGMDKSLASERVKLLVDAFSLQEYFETPIISLSMGTRQKVSIISALIHKPSLLILDEPFIGLDARTVAIMKGIIREHVKEGGSVLFSTHIMEVAEKICTKIGIIHRGRLVAEGSVLELTSMVEAPNLEKIFLKVTGEEEEVSRIIRGLDESL